MRNGVASSELDVIVRQIVRDAVIRVSWVVEAASLSGSRVDHFFEHLAASCVVEIDLFLR